MTIKTIELSQIDARYEDYRLKDPRRERELLPSIADAGIREPLLGVLKGEGPLLLLDGFKRWRCARKLSLNILPYEELDQDEAMGIIKLLKISNNRSLHLLEQAMLVDELKEAHGMKVHEIAHLLERSSAWVSVRLGVLAELGPQVLEQVFQGKFPAQNLLYTLRPFRRLNKIPRDEIERFVKAVGGQGLSVREVDVLAQGYFKGGQEIKEQIQHGKIPWALEYLKDLREHTSGEAPEMSDKEKRMIQDLEIVRKYMGILSVKLSSSVSLPSPSFRATAALLVEGILGAAPLFTERIQQFSRTLRQGPHD